MSDAVARVVISAEVVGGSFMHPECRRLLEMWRDGVVQPVITRELLLKYLRLLRNLGVREELLQTWMLWFTATDRAIYLGEFSCGGDPGLMEIARRGGAKYVIRRMKSKETAGEEIQVVTPAEFVLVRCQRKVN